jgi:ribonucleases P/MRP protein subunit RPP40
LERIIDWLVSIKSPSRTDVVYIDFSKAFDTVVTSKLLVKLECYGITGLLLRWIKCFLCNRTQCVVLKHCHSSFTKVTNSIPQGPVLGPILFLMYINDIDTVCSGNTHLQLFADDAKLCSTISINEVSVLLQRSRDNLCAWANNWQLTINISKCAVLSISCRIPAISHSYFIHGISILHQGTSCVDLGITISYNLAFSDNISNIVSCARQRTSILYRGFASRNNDILKHAFIAYIRPIVEYNSVVWNPRCFFN